jgi:hypothetical protein
MVMTRKRREKHLPLLFCTLMAVNPVDTTASLPLTQSEKDHLRHVFNVRLRIFCAGYAFITGFILKILLPFAQLDDDDLQHPSGKPGDYEVFGHVVTNEDLFYVLLAVFGGFALITGSVLFFKRIYCLRKDMEYGRKDAVIFTITNKLFFEHTNQFFLSLDNPKYLHHEVDAGFFSNCNIGDKVVLYRTKFSRLVFDKDLRFTLM